VFQTLLLVHHLKEKGLCTFTMGLQEGPKNPFPR